VLFVSGCSMRPQKKIQFVDFGEIEISCNRLTDDDDRNRVASIASNYFISNVGADVKEMKIGNISECKDTYVVPVIANIPPEIGLKPWYVDIKKKGMTPTEIGRPE